MAGQHDLTLTIKVSGGTSNKGQVILSLFNTQDNYMKTPILSKTKPINNRGEVVFIVRQLKTGMYAATVIYDADGNGKLNTGFLGIPKELVGFSNNVKGTFGPPTFNAAAFSLSTSETLQIDLGKVKD